MGDGDAGFRMASIDSIIKNRNIGFKPRIADMTAEIEHLESLSNESLIALLNEQLKPHIFPRQCSVRVRKLSEKDVKLFNRFLKVDSITPLTKNTSKVTYTVKDSRIESEMFEKKHKTIKQELDRVRTLMANRRQWCEIYNECVALIEERAVLHSEVDELENFIEANTPSEDDIDLEPNPEAELKLQEAIKRKKQLLFNDTGLRKKEEEMQSTMKNLDLARKSLERLGVIFNEDVSWMDDAKRESEESLLAKLAADKKAEKEGSSTLLDDDEVEDEWMDKFEESLLKQDSVEDVDDDNAEELGPEESKTGNEEVEEDADDKMDVDDVDDLDDQADS